MSLAVLLLFAALTGRWWAATLRALLDDLRVASDPPDVLERETREPSVHVRSAVEIRARGPLQRRLAFRGIARRVARRRRWEGGFGRRGL